MPTQKTEVQVYATRTCPYCVAARQLLDGLGVAYTLRDLSGEPDPSGVMEAILPGHQTVPLIVIGDEPVGGYSDLAALHERGELRSKVFSD